MQNRFPSVTRLLPFALGIIATMGTTFAQEPDAATLRSSLQQAVQRQEWPAAEAAAAKLVEHDATDATAWFHLGYSRHAQKKFTEALEAHVKAANLDNPNIKPVATYNAACVYALQDNADEAFTWLDKAIAAGFSDANQIKTDADLKSLHADDRFAPLVERVEKLASRVRVQAFAYTTPRKCARLAYFAGANSGGQIAIDYAAVPWAERYAGALDNERFVGQRWRFGADAWTNLDISVPVTFGETRLEPGYYYLTLAHMGDKKCVIHALDPAEVRKAGIDPVTAHRTTGGKAIALDYAAIEGATEPLTIELQIDGSDKTKGKLTVKFGPHELTAPMTVEIAGR